jgi:hypothetical protein
MATDTATDTTPADDLALRQRQARARQVQPGQAQSSQRDAVARLTDQLNTKFNTKLTFRDVDDAVRSVASGATFGLADEAAAMGNTLLGGEVPRAGDIFGDERQSAYARNLAAERARDREIPANIAVPGELAGGLMTGNALARSGLTLLNAARPTATSMALRGGIEGGTYGAAYGLGHGEGAGGRARGAAWGAGTGAVTGAALGAVTGAVASRSAAKDFKKSVPTTEELKRQSQQAYRAADEAGVVITPDKLGPAAADITAAARAEGMNNRLHSRAAGLLADFGDDVRASPQSLSSLDQWRRQFKTLTKSSEPDEQRIGHVILDKLDDYVENLRPADVHSGDVIAGTQALKDARSTWSRFRKTDSIEALIGRARLKSDSTGSSLGTALRGEFRTLALNPKRMRTFSKTEQRAIEKVATGKVAGALNLLSKFAPQSPLTALLGSGGAYLAGGVPGAVGLPAAAGAARLGETYVRNNAAQEALAEVATGRAPPGVSQLTPEELLKLRTLLIGTSQQGYKAKDTVE